MADLFFVFSKIFWAIAQPDSLLLLLIGAGASALWLGRPRLGRVLATLALAATLAIGFLPIGDALLEPVEALWPAPSTITGPAAGIVVLGGAEDRAATRRWGVPAANHAGERFIAAIALAYRHPAARAILTGGGGEIFRPATSPTESQIAEQFLRAGGVDPSRILLESRSRNTVENAAFSLALARSEGLAGDGPWLLVTSARHMPRAVEAFCAAGWRGLVPWPVDFRSGDAAPWPQWRLAGRFELLSLGAKERIGLLAYRLTGRATPPEEVPGCLVVPD